MSGRYLLHLALCLQTSSIPCSCRRDSSDPARPDDATDLLLLS